MAIRELLERRRADILRIAAEHGAAEVRVFGSAARGEDGEGSDVNFLVRFMPDVGLLEHAGLCLDLEDLLGRPVDVVSEKALAGPFRERVLREALTL